MRFEEHVPRAQGRPVLQPFLRPAAWTRDMVPRTTSREGSNTVEGPWPSAANAIPGVSVSGCERETHSSLVYATADFSVSLTSYSNPILSRGGFSGATVALASGILTCLELLQHVRRKLRCILFLKIRFY